MKKTLVMATIVATGLATSAFAVTFKGASQFDNKHAYNRGMLKFGKELKKCDSSIRTRLSGSSTLGVEKDYLNFMVKGNAVDYAIISPAHMAGYSQRMSLLSMPFLFRDVKHWRTTLDSGVFNEVIREFERKADVLVLGLAGGSIRNIISNVKVSSDKEIKGLKIRVQGAPVHAKIWSAVGAKPAAISYSEVYNAIQTGVVNALENGAGGLEAMKFYEVAKHIGVTRHTISVRPLLFSGKTFRKLNAKQQDCVIKAGKIGANYARKLESSEDQAKQDKLKKAGLIKVYEIKNHAKVLKKVEPVKKEFAKSVGAMELLDAINKL